MAFQRKHPRAAVDALVAAVVDGGMSARAARDALAAGELPGYSVAAEIPLATARDYAAAERARRSAVSRAALGGPALLVDAADRLAHLTSRRVDRAAARARAGHLTPRELADLGVAIREAARAQREAAALTSRPGQTAQGEPAAGLVDRLAGEQ